MSTHQKTTDSYNENADMWSSNFKEGKNAAHEHLEKPAMKSKLPNLSGKKVLAMGCGSGEEIEMLKNAGAKEIVGVDISSELIKNAKSAYPDIEFHVMDIEKLDFEDEYFDFIYSSLTMHYLES